MLALFFLAVIVQLEFLIVTDRGKRKQMQQRLHLFVGQRIDAVPPPNVGTRTVLKGSNPTVAGEFSPVFEAGKSFRYEQEINRSDFANTGNAF